MRFSSRFDNLPRWKEVARAVQRLRAQHAQLHPARFRSKSMKDGQTDLSGQGAYIPVISPTLHVLAMPALIFLRSSFGYLYLRPKSIFLSLSLASTLLFIVAINEPAIWAEFRDPVIFAFATACVYCVHLLIAIVAQTSENAEADTYSGTSHLLWLFRDREKVEIHFHLWAEPLFVLAVTIVADMYGSTFLSYWLALTAVALALKELRTYWSELRKRKRKVDMQEETQDEDDLQTGDSAPSPPARTRKPKRHHRRHLG